MTLLYRTVIYIQICEAKKLWLSLSSEITGWFDMAPASQLRLTDFFQIFSLPEMEDFQCEIASSNAVN